MSQDEPIETFGMESLCTTCRFGRALTVRYTASPSKVAEWKVEHDGQDHPYAKPMNILEVQCTNPVFVGRWGRSRDMAENGTAIVSCEEYRSRDVPEKLVVRALSSEELERVARASANAPADVLPCVCICGEWRSEVQLGNMICAGIPCGGPKCNGRGRVHLGREKLCMECAGR